MMSRTFAASARFLTGILAMAGCALPQAYTISAKPGAVSYVEGNVSVNGAPLVSSALRGMFLSKSDSLTTETGKAEVLLTPGVFLRLGENSEVRMISPSLVDMQVELVSGQAMIEVDQAMQGTTIGVMDHGSSTILSKTGLYRFTAKNEPTAAVLEGKADVYFGAKKTELGKNKQALLTDELTVSKLDLSKADDLYAWSNVRAQYDAAVSYQGSNSVYNSGGYGYGSGYQSSGLYWNSPYSSWMWLPGNGAFYSPFGWGFYGPSVVAFAPLAGYGYGYGYAGGTYYQPVTITGKPLPVPVNPKHPGVVVSGATPAAYAAIREQVQHSIQSTGYQFHSRQGSASAVLPAGHVYSSPQEANRAAAASARTSHATASSGSGSGGGWTGGSSASSSSASPRSSSISSGATAHSSSGGGRAR